MPTAPTNSLELLDLIKKSGIIPQDQFASISDLTLPNQPEKAAAALIQKGLVTRFQAGQLLAGRHKGFRLGGYTVLDLLGRGGMGAVYLGEHLALRRKVAIKILVLGKDEDQKLALDRFQREARAVAALDHPNIVKIFDVAKHNGLPYLVMEFVEGETLQQAIDREGKIPFETAAEYIAQAAAGLQQAHEKGIVHRDIKPGNLILDTTGTIKILDMGLARSASAQDKLTAQLEDTVVGTADFIAPEQAINSPSIDIRADIYSLGATLFALIIGKPPFEGNTTQKLLQHQLRSAPTLHSMNSAVPVGLSDVVARMLAKDPADRYQTPAEVISELTPWVASSSKILVGLSRTSHAEDQALQASLSGSHRVGSSHKLPSIAGDSDFHTLPTLQSSTETGRISSAKTMSEVEHSLPKPVLPKARKARTILIVAILGAIAFSIGIGAWLALGRQ